MVTRVISRSGHEALNTCPRRFYYGYEFGGKGLDSPTPDLKLIIGLAVHKGLEQVMLWLKADPSGSLVVAASAAEVAKTEFNRLTVQHRKGFADDPVMQNRLDEATMLVFALVYVWCQVRLERFAATYEVLQVEEELRTPLSPTVVLASRLDVLVRERATGLVYVINWKTGEEKDPLVVRNKHEHDSQMWAEAFAAEYALGEPVQGSIVEALYKGVTRNGTFVTPLLYFYRKGDEVRITYSAVKGWIKCRADQWDGGLLAWLNYLINNYRETAMEQIILIDPILKDNTVVEDRLRSWVYREEAAQHVLATGSEEDKLTYFGPRDGFWCKWCIFKGPCKEGRDIKQMVANGELIPRVDHHGEGEGSG